MKKSDGFAVKIVYYMNMKRKIIFVAVLGIALAVFVILDIVRQDNAKSTAAQIVSSGRTWIRLQQTYVKDVGTVGSAQRIGYAAPESNYFEYRTILNDRETATWTAMLKEPLGRCQEGIWSIVFTAAQPKEIIRVEIRGGENCEALVSNFRELGNN